MRPRLLILVATAVALPLAGCHTAPGSASPSTSAVANAAGWDAPTRLLVDSAGARLTALEVRRVALRAEYSDTAPEMQAVHRQITALERLLAAVPASETARARALSAVLSALAQREAGLQSQRAQLLIEWSPGSKPVRRVDAELQALAERRGELELLERSRTAGR